MAATVVEVSKAVATQLSTGTYSQPVRFERRYLSLKQLASQEHDWGHVGLTENIAVIRPATRLSEPLTRGGHVIDEVGVEVTLFRQAKATTVEEIDDLLGLLEEICDRARLQVEAGPGVWVRTVGEPMVDAEAMLQHDVFMALVTLVYRCQRR
jgi:hypothetical protein